MKNMTVAEEILNQLGGNRFIAMTGAKNFVSDGNSLRMTLPKNHSKANKLVITLDADDTYTVHFFKYTPSKLKVTNNTAIFVEEKIIDVYKVSGIYCDQLQEIFTEVTWMYTHL